MKYDFDTVVSRQGTASLKWDIKENVLPMWVADMDFPTAPEIISALKRRVDHGIFGYSVIPQEWYQAYIDWWHTRHGFVFTADDMVFSAGVVPTLSSAVRRFSAPGENVAVLTPVYNIFFNSIVNNGRKVRPCPLKYDSGTHSYSIDPALLEEVLSDPQTSLMLFCNPHNPAGIIWSRDELDMIGRLCEKYGVTVVSDEIHCDLCDHGYKYTPFASVSEINARISITCIAPTKAFNIAGIQTSAVVAKDPVLRHRIWRQLNTDEVGEPNVFACTAACAAFCEGGRWLDELRTYIAQNREYAQEYIRKNIPVLDVVPSHATYLVWIDCSKTGIASDKLCDDILEKTGLFLSDGVQYGSGEGFFRMNIACPRSVLCEGLGRLSSYFGSTG